EPTGARYHVLVQRVSACIQSDRPGDRAVIVVTSDRPRDPARIRQRAWAEAVAAELATRRLAAAAARRRDATPGRPARFHAARGVPVPIVVPAATAGIDLRTHL